MHDAQAIALLLFLIVGSLAAGHYLHKRRIFWLPGCGATILVGGVAGLLIYNLSDHAEADFLEFDPENFTLFLLPPIIFEAGYDLKVTRDATATPPSQRLPPPGSSKYRAGGKGQRARACPPLV